MEMSATLSQLYSLDPLAILVPDFLKAAEHSACERMQAACRSLGSSSSLMRLVLVLVAVIVDAEGCPVIC